MTLKFYKQLKQLEKFAQAELELATNSTEPNLSLDARGSSAEIILHQLEGLEAQD